MDLKKKMKITDRIENGKGRSVEFMQSYLTIFFFFFLSLFPVLIFFSAHLRGWTFHLSIFVYIYMYIRLMWDSFWPQCSWQLCLFFYNASMVCRSIFRSFSRLFSHFLIFSLFLPFYHSLHTWIGADFFFRIDKNNWNESMTIFVVGKNWVPAMEAKSCTKWFFILRFFLSVAVE